MNLLFVLSQTELTGAETYAVSLIKKLSAKNYKIAIVSDTLNSKINIPYYPLDIDNRKPFINRLKHIKSLCRIIKEEKVNLLHAHSRASSYVSYFASRLSNIPLVTTAHCIYPIHLSRRILPCFGEKVIAICGAVKDHLIKDLKVKAKNVFLIPNGINIDNFKPNLQIDQIREEFGVQNGTKVISWIGRFSGPRGKLIEEVVEKVFPKILTFVPNLIILIVGGGKKSYTLEDKVRAINHQLGRQVIRFTGLREDIPQICALSYLIIGAGRVALEAMACGRPVISLGENRLVGLIDPHTIEQGIYTNFGDCCEYQPVDWEKLTSTIIEILKDEKKAEELGKWGRKIVIEQFDLEKVTNKVEKIYEALAK